MKRNLYLLLITLVALALLVVVIRHGPGETTEPSGTSPAPTTTEPPKPAETKLSLVAVGDNLIHDTIYKWAKTEGGYDFRPMYTQIKGLVQAADIAFVNQEAPLSALHDPSGYPMFNSPQEVGLALADTGFQIVNQANNHGIDKGERGVLSTVDFWEGIPGVMMIGFNRSEEERGIVRVQEIEGLKLAWLAYSFSTNGIRIPEPYLMNMIDREAMAADIREAKRLADAIIVSLHWGNEYEHQPNREQKDLAQFLADQGVLLIIGHHPHVIQPVEWLEGQNGNRMLVAYSLGNFVSSQNRANRMLGGMLSCDILFRDGEVSLENAGVIPLVTHYESGYKNYSIYPLKDYTPELAGRHLVGKTERLSIDYFDSLSRQVLGEFYYQSPGVPAGIES